jgi:hypothetical protein
MRGGNGGSSGQPETFAQGNPSDALPAIGANRKSMIQRFDQIAVDLPEPSGPNPAAAAAIQELMGGKGLEHHLCVKAGHIMLVGLARRKLRFDNLQRLELIEYRPLSSGCRWFRLGCKDSDRGSLEMPPAC